MPYKYTLSKAALTFVEIEPKEMLRCVANIYIIALFIYSEKNGSYINNC